MRLAAPSEQLPARPEIWAVRCADCRLISRPAHPHKVDRPLVLLAIIYGLKAARLSIWQSVIRQTQAIRKDPSIFEPGGGRRFKRPPRCCSNNALTIAKSAL